MYPEQDQSPREGVRAFEELRGGVWLRKETGGTGQESDLALGAVAQQLAAAHSGGAGLGRGSVDW